MGWRSYVSTEDIFALLLSCAITLGLGLQGLINMAVVLGLIPTKGLNLPFISYGGSALLVDLWAVGILLNISRYAQGKSTRSSWSGATYQFN